MATNWGIISAGKISHDFVSALRTLPSNEHYVEAIAARSLESAQEFAKLHRIPKAYGSYEELAKDANIEVVYIGAIHPYHFSVAKLMLQNRKHVLVEKPMTLNLKCTQQLISLAREKQLFIMEALWSRFLPSYEFVMKTIRNGVIGDVFHVSAELGKNNAHIDRVSKKALGGGTLLNFGIYAINIIEMVFKNEIPEKISSIAHLNDEGVDESVCAALQFSGGKTAVFSTHSRVQFTNEAHIVGTKGIIKLAFPLWCPDRVYLNDVVHEFPFPPTHETCNFDNGSGLRYEAIEVRNCLNSGLLESQIMSHKDSILLATIMEDMKKQIGVQYDVDRNA